MEKQKNEELLKSETVLIVTNLIQFLAVFVIVPFFADSLPAVLMYLLMSLSFVAFIGAALYAVKLEADTGYYECGKCHHRYVGTYKKALLAPHIGRTRYLECPECHERSWQKKVLEKN